MRYLREFFFLLAVSLSAACSPVIETVSKNEVVPQSFDGALLSYAFARGEVSIAASYKSGGLSIAAPQFTPQPDLNHVHALLYGHGPLSIDQPDIQLDGVMLKMVSSTTQDQTVAAVQALNSLLTQIGTTQAALNKPGGGLIHALTVAPAQCTDDIQVSRVVDVTYGKVGPLSVNQSGQKCHVELDVKVTPPIKTFGIAGFPRPGDDSITEDYCNQAVCFRLTGAYVVVSTATLIGPAPDRKVMATVTSKQQVLAPQQDAIGFVRFNRRAFVTNTTSITFANGMISEFKSSDPSEIVGFFTLPVALLQTAAILK
jgi:hypothetical protein